MIVRKLGLTVSLAVAFTCRSWFSAFVITSC